MKFVFPHCFLFVLLLTSCNQKHSGEQKTTLASNFLSITDNEDKGIKEIIQTYGGECEYGFSKSTGIYTKGKDAFWLEIRKSETIDNSKVKPELIGSNIAYLFYRNLKEEKDKYAEIQVKVKYRNGETYEFTYAVAVLERVLKQYEVVEKIYSYIKNKDFKSLSEHFKADETVTDTPAEVMVKKLKQAEDELAPIKELVPYGFRFINRTDGQEVLYIAAILLRDKGISPFSLYLDPNSKDYKIYLLNYSF